MSNYLATNDRRNYTMSTEPEPTPPQQDPNKLLMDVLEEFKKVSQDLKIERQEKEQLKKDLGDLKKFISEDLPKQFDGKVNELASATADTFMKLGKVIDDLPKKVEGEWIAPNQQPQSGEPSGFGGLVKSIIDAVTNAAKQPAAPNELMQFDKDIALMGRKIMTMTYQKALRDFSKSAGLAIPEAAEHIVVTE
jgi:hypothetical protein